ncbi:uncharacterized protein LOC134714436 [Mytilus trossulus]|uniref:uncharacterized protein LOC134714436 n=1 Tax=Mytilus trossulus TaxID=6551 RepID=UPI003007575A
MWIIFLAFVKTFLFDVSNALAPPDFVSNWMQIQAYVNPEVDISHGLDELPLKVEVQVKVFDTFLSRDMYFLAMGSAQKGNDNNLPFGGVLYLYNNETIKILAPGPKNCVRPECTGLLVYLGENSTFHGNSSIARSFSTGYVRARVWRACSLPRPSFISNAIPMSSGDTKDLPHGHKPSWVIVRVHIDQGWVYEAQGSVFYETSSNPFGGVVFAYSDTHLRLWVPKKGPGSSRANGVPFNAMNGWGETGDFGYSETVTVRAFVWNFLDTNFIPTNPIVLTQTSYITSPSFISVGPGYSLHADNSLILFAVKANTGDNAGFQFYPAGSSMTDGTTSSTNTKYGSFVYGYTDDKIYYWTPEDAAQTSSGCVLLMGGLWGSNSKPHCLSKSDVSLEFTFNVLSIREPACGSFSCAGASDRGPECNCTGSGKEGQFCDSGVTCLKPIDHRNANLAPLKNRYNHQEDVTFSCKTGYYNVSGSSGRQCQEDKSWSGESYLCDPVPCGDPDNGTFSMIVVITGTVYLNSVNYECINGYGHLSGDDVRNCQQDGTWNGSVLICEKSCTEESVPDGVIRTNDGNLINTNATFDCKPGFTYVGGDLIRQCGENGSWSGEPFNCTRISCGAPPNITKGSVTFTSTLFEANSLYTCDVGYINSQSGLNFGTVACDHTGSWTSELPDCQLVECQDPALITHGSWNTSTQYFYGDIITYQCNRAFALIGVESRTCQADKTWSGEPPTCRAVMCPNFVVPNGNVFASNYSVDGFLAVSCNDGFTLNGSIPMFCLVTGDWSGAVPQCINTATSTTGNGSSQNNGQTDTTQMNPKDYIYKVDKKTTSSFQRKLVSAPDDRTSAIVVGWVGVIVLTAVVAIIMSFDCINICQKAGGKTRKRSVRDNSSRDSDIPHVIE